MADRQLCLLARMNKSAHAVGEQHVYFFRFDYGCYFADAEFRMQQRLTFTISSRPIIGATFSD